MASLELFRKGDTGDVRVQFAYELVASAMIRRRDAARHTIEEFTLEAFRFLGDAVRHAQNASRIILMTEFLPKFKG